MRPSRDALLLLALAGLLLLVGLGRVALTDRDEGANAEAAREMLAEGAWITPTLNGLPRFAKPAFVYWLTAGAYAVLGVSETAARLPSAVAALALVLVQLAFARWAFGRAARSVWCFLRTKRTGFGAPTPIATSTWRSSRTTS